MATGHDSQNAESDFFASLTPIEQLKHSVSSLANIFDSARLHFERWMALKWDVPEVQEERLPIEIHAFIEHARFAHYKCMILDLYMILDTNPRAASAQNLLKDARSLNLVDDAECEQARRHLTQIHGSWDKVRRLRHSLFAHTQRGVQYSVMMDDVSVMVPDFEHIIDGGLSAVGILWAKLFVGSELRLEFDKGFYRDETKAFLSMTLKPYVKNP